MRRARRTSSWLVGLLLVATAPAVAQDPTVAVPADSAASPSGPATLLKGMPQMGFFGAPFSRFGYIRQQLAVYPGMRLGVVLDQSFAIGVSVGLLANHVALDTIPGNDLGLKYGGLELEAIIASRKLVHGSLRVLGGAGLLQAGPASPSDAGEGDGGETPAPPGLAPAEKILIVEPAAEITLNVSSMLRLSLGASYRLVRGVDSTLIGNDDLSGWLGSVTLRIVRF